MARQAREKANFLHVIIRGVGKQILFEDNSDRYYLLSLLKRYKDDLNINILAYCLMDNHVHFLIQNPEYNISLFMHKVCLCYATYYNRKYDRVGHMFQNRYKSETITDTAYLLTAFRYILKNPEKAGIAPANHYTWNSYSDYGKPDRLTDTSLIVSLIGSPSEFNLFMAENDETECMEDTAKKKDDTWALNIIKNTLHISSGTNIQKMERKERNEALALLRSKGVSIRQLERLTGITRGIILNAGKVVNGDRSNVV